MKPLDAGRFFVTFWKKIAVLMPCGSHFAVFFRAIGKPTIEKIPTQNTFKISHFGVKSCDLAQLGQWKQVTLLSATSVSLNNSLEYLP